MANRIDKDVEVTIVNNTQGSFGYNFKDTLIELESFGDEDYLTFGELKTMMSSKHKNILKKLMLLITDIDSEEYTVDDVINQLKLDGSYKSLREIIENIDENSHSSIIDFIQESKTEDFEKALEDKNLSKVLVESATSLYKDGELSDYTKLRAVGKAIGIEDFNTYFSDIAPK